MSPTAELLVLLLTGAGLAFANTLASSGSALSLPVLLAVGLGPELANGTNRVAVLAGALAAMASFVRAGRIQWPIVRPLMVVAAIGAVVGAAISEKISPTSMHLAITGALLVALTLLAIKPSRWLTDSETPPRVGPIQLLLILAISIWAGFIVLDGMTYLLMALVLSVAGGAGGRWERRLEGGHAAGDRRRDRWTSRRPAGVESRRGSMDLSAAGADHRWGGRAAGACRNAPVMCVRALGSNRRTEPRTLCAPSVRVCR